MKNILILLSLLLCCGFAEAQTLQVSNYGTKGYIKDDEIVQNNSYMTIGYARGVKKEWAAVAFFFFRFD
jgi:hypothetical protein